jgi:hypothetical protein
MKNIMILEINQSWIGKSINRRTGTDYMHKAERSGGYFSLVSYFTLLS